MILHGGISRKGMEETGEGNDCLCDSMSIRVCVHHVSCLKSGASDTVEQLSWFSGSTFLCIISPCGCL